MVYQSKISSTVIIDNKTGRARLEDLKIDVNGFSNREELKRAKESYNAGKKMEIKYYGKDWRKSMWYHLLDRCYSLTHDFRK